MDSIGMSMNLSTSFDRVCHRWPHTVAALTLALAAVACEPGSGPTSNDPDPGSQDSAPHADAVCGVDAGRPSPPNMDGGEGDRRDAAPVPPRQDAVVTNDGSSADAAAADAGQIPDLGGNPELGLNLNPSLFCNTQDFPIPGLLEHLRENLYPWPMDCIFEEHLRALAEGIPLHFITGIEPQAVPYDAIFYLGRRGFTYGGDFDGSQLSLGIRTGEQAVPPEPGEVQCIRVLNADRGAMVRLDATARMIPVDMPLPDGIPWAEAFVFGSLALGIGDDHELTRDACDQLTDAPPGSIDWPVLDLAQ